MTFDEMLTAQRHVALEAMRAEVEQSLADLKAEDGFAQDYAKAAQDYARDEERGIA